MNTFGRLFRVSIFGASHGEAVGVNIDGCPPGLPLTVEDFADDLKRRRPGEEGTTSRKEEDVPLIKSGLLKDRTTGTPILILFPNSDVKPQDYDAFRSTPRPGHTDFVAIRKYGGFADLRGGGAFSGRLTVGLVAAGVIAKKLMKPTTFAASIIEVGGTWNVKRMVSRMVKEKDSIGGLIECRIKDLPVGMGEPFFDSIESLISHYVFSIPGIKGIEFGAGFQSARMRGSKYNDVIVDSAGKTRTNHSGGINGGISNGNEVVFRAAARPPASIAREQQTVDLSTGKPALLEAKGRHDSCIALRIPVIIEAAAACALADLALRSRVIPNIWES
jgi:chorismate synthase